MNFYGINMEEKQKSSLIRVNYLLLCFPVCSVWKSKVSERF